MKFLKLIALFILSISLFSCGDDDKPSSVNVDMKLHVDGTDLKMGQAYTINDTPVKFDVTAIYIGDPEFTVSGKTYTGSDRYYLLRPGTLSFSLGEVEGKKFEGANFNIGIDEITNALEEDDYNSRPSTDPLGVQDPSMHWSWNSGYRFARIDAFADLDNDGEFETKLNYHTGTNELFRSVAKTTSIDLKEGANTIEIGIDVAEALDDIDFSIEENQKTHTFNNKDLAVQIANNLKNSVTVELK